MSGFPISTQIPWSKVENFLKKKGLYILVLIIGGFLVYFLQVIPLTYERDQLSNEKDQLSKQLASLSANTLQMTEAGESKCINSISGKFPDDQDDWVIQQYDEPDKEGFYCPRLHSDFPSPDIWYENSIPTKFESIEFRYKVKNRNEDIDIFPSFIISFGKNPYVFRFYLPLESNPQLVGFQKIKVSTSSKSGYDLERENARELKAPIKDEVENELKIRMSIEQGNKAIFSFNPIYISAKTEESIEDGISYNLSFPNDPKPGSEFSETKIGFGTFKGSCVKPISYKFCY